MLEQGWCGHREYVSGAARCGVCRLGRRGIGFRGTAAAPDPSSSPCHPLHPCLPCVPTVASRSAARPSTTTRCTGGCWPTRRAPAAARCSSPTTPCRALSNDRVPASVLARLERPDAAAVLADRWPGTCLTCSELARAVRGDLSRPRATVRRRRGSTAGRRRPGGCAGGAEPRHLLLGIASVGRPADVPAAAGWTRHVQLLGRRRRGVRGAAQLGGPVRRGSRPDAQVDARAGGGGAPVDRRTTASGWLPNTSPSPATTTRRRPRP